MSQHFSPFLRLVLPLLFLVGCEQEQQAAPKVIEPVTVRVVHDPQTESVLKPLIEKFAQNNQQLSDGTPVRLELHSRPAVVAAQEIADGRLKTELWLSPMSALTDWVNTHLQNLGPAQVECLSLFATPMVFATRKEHLSLFGAKDDSFSWETFFRNRYPRASQWLQDARVIGMSHLLPQRRAEGLAAVAQLFALAIPDSLKSSPNPTLTPAVLETVKEYESIAFSYPEEQSTALQRITAGNANDLFFFLTTEQQVAHYNLQRSQKGRPLNIRALYPSEGSYWLDYRICRSDADWVTPAHRAVARNLIEYLRDTEEAQLAFRRAGFRPTTIQFENEPPLISDFGVNPRLPAVSVPSMASSDMAFFLDTWTDLRRPEAVVFVLDSSASMEEEGFDAAQRAYRRLVAEFSDRDIGGLISFSTEPRVLSPMTSDKFQLLQSMDKALPLGGSAVYDAIKAAFDLLQESKTDSFRQKILVITDGDDKNSNNSYQRLSQILERRPDQRDVRLIIFALTKNRPSHPDLAFIAESTNGEYYATSIEKLEELVEQKVSE